MKNSSPNTKVVFSSIVVHKDEKHVVKKFAESCWNYFYQKTLILLIIETLLKIRSEIVIIIEDFINLKFCLNMKHVTRPQKRPACKNLILTKTIKNVLIINFFF